MYSFTDFYGNFVQLTFSKENFSQNVKHVWVVCRYKDQWLLTKHPKRGYEFPGGKVESAEHPFDAAFREVYEETGATIKMLHYVGQYKVFQKDDDLIKNIYFAEISEIKDVPHFYETAGPILVKKLPMDIKRNELYSFIMKDQVLPLTLKEIQQNICKKRNPS